MAGSINFVAAIMLLGAAQEFFLVVLILAKKKRRRRFGVFACNFAVCGFFAFPNGFASSGESYKSIDNYRTRNLSFSVNIGSLALSLYKILG